MGLQAYRGTGIDRPTEVPLPPDRLPLFRGLRLRKRWRYVGIWSETVLVCAARVTVGPVPQEFWGVWDRTPGRLHAHIRLRRGRVDMTPGGVVVRDGTTRIEVTLAEGPGAAFEVVTPIGRGYTWTRKQAVRAQGRLTVAGEQIGVDAVASIDDNDGYHPAHPAGSICSFSDRPTANPSLRSPVHSPAVCP